MVLTPQDVGLFFKLHWALMFYLNQRLQVIPDAVASPEAFSAVAPELRLKVRDALLGHMDLVESFVEENPVRLASDELAIVRSWRHLVHGKFYLFRQLQKYMVFLSTGEEPIAYGVLALSQPFEEMVGPYLPVLADTVLLPFKGRIVYDGLLNSYRISFGPGIRRSLNESYQEAKAVHGIVTSLPMSNEPLPVKAPKPKPAPKPPSKEQKDEVLRAIIGLIDQFCREHLNEEYAVLCRELAEKLARKRPSPLLHGSPSTWASGIVRTIGWVNFLDDKTQTPHLRLSDIDAGFGVGASSGAAKLAAIRKMLNIHRFDPTWTLPSHLEDNPLVWTLEVNGLLMDVRQAPREVQEIAFHKGLSSPTSRRIGRRQGSDGEVGSKRAGIRGRQGQGAGRSVGGFEKGPRQIVRGSRDRNRGEGMMRDSIWPQGKGGNQPLPVPNVVVARAGTPPEQLSPEAIRGILVNPIYAGVGPFPRLVDDATWVRACAKLIETEGPEQFLVNLLYVLRECFQDESTG